MAASKGRGSQEAPPREWSRGQPDAEMQLKLQSQQEDLEQLKTELASQKVGRREGGGGFGHLQWWGRTGWRLDRGGLTRSPVIQAWPPSRKPPAGSRASFLISFWGPRGRKARSGGRQRLLLHCLFPQPLPALSAKCDKGLASPALVAERDAGWS